MAYDNKPNLSCLQFDQKNDNYLYLCGHNVVKDGGTINSYSGYQVSGVTIFNTGVVPSAVQVGCNSKALAIASTAIGVATVTRGIASVAIGCRACSDGESSISIGNNSVSCNKYGISLGYSITKGKCAIGIGHTESCYDGSIAIGDRVISNAQYATAIGTNIINSIDCSFGLGWYDGGMGYENPGINFSNNKSYFFGCGSPLVGFGICDPLATVDIKTSVGQQGFRLNDGNQALGKALISDVNGFGTWQCISVLSGATGYIPIFTNNTKIGNSKLKQINNNIFEFQYSGNTIIRGISGTTQSSSIEIHSGVKYGTDTTNPLILKSSEIKICQPEGNKHAKISSAGGTGLHLNANTGSAILAGEGVYLGICSGNYVEDIMFYPHSISETLMCIKRPSNLIIQGYTGCETNLDGCNVFVQAGCGNQNEFSNAHGGCVVLRPGISSGTGNGGCLILDTTKDTYMCHLGSRTSETCTLFINAQGKISYGYNSAAAICGTQNYIGKFNADGNSIIDSTIYQIGDIICLGSQNIFLGNILNNSAVVVQPRVGECESINLLIKAGCNGINETDGQLFLDPGRGGYGEGQYVNIGSDTYNGSYTGLIPHGIEDDITMSIRGKNNGPVEIISNGGVMFGTTSNLMCVNGDILSKLIRRNLCITGYDTNTNNVDACSILIRGGNGCANNSRGGNVILQPGIGYGSVLNGDIMMCNLKAQTTENKILYISNTGAISCGTSNVFTASNGITLLNGNFILGGSLTGNTTISAPLNNYKLNICNGVTLNTQYGYQISGTTMFKSPNNSTTSVYIGNTVGTQSGGLYNVGIGNNTLNGITNGCNNLGIGSYSLYGNQSGCHNISIGSSNMQCNTTGNENIALGKSALFSNVSGCRNVAIGLFSLYNNTTGSNNVAIGSYSGCGVNSSNKLYISNSSQCTLIYGEFDNKMVRIGGDLCATGNVCGNSFVNTSDIRCKTNIKPIDNQRICVEYQEFCYCNDDRKRYGVIAQDIKDCYPELVHSNKEGILGVSYIDLLIKEVSYLKNKVNELEEKINNIT